MAASSNRVGLGVAVVGLFMALTPFANAQVEVTGNGSAVEPFSIEDFDPDSSPELDMPIRLLLPDWSELPSQRGELLDQVALGAKIPGTIRLRYRGLQGFLLKHIDRRLRKEWNKSISSQAKSVSFNQVAERRRLQVQRSNAMADHKAGGRWWERRWFYSFAEAKGGAPKRAYTQTIGKTVTVLKIGAFTLNNQFRGRLDKVAVLQFAEPGRIYRGLFDGEEPLQARTDAQLSREDNPHPNNVPETIPEGEDKPKRIIAPACSLDLWLDLETKERSLWGTTFRFKVRPGVHTRVTTEKIKVSVRLKAALQISVGVREARRRVLDVEFAMRYKPLENEVRAELELVLVRW